MKKIHKIILAVTVAIVLFIGGACWYVIDSLSPVAKESSEILVNIVENTSPNQVVEQLQNQNVIKNAFSAKILMKFAHLSDIKAGVYKLDPSWGTKKVLAYVNDATNAESNEVLLTIPEGLWSKDIAKRIAEITNVTAEECLQLWNDDSFLKEMIATYEFLDESILNNETFVKLEGYLYPDSYFIFRETNAKEVTLRLLDGFDVAYHSIRDDLKESAMSVHDLVTFASVVQFESGNPEEMPIISSIFHNRFEVGMKMESSVTVCYALYDKFNNFMDCETNPDIDSPYNTYLYEGLPLGPVNNPSLDAMNAVLHPADTDYYYFISDVYGDGKLHPAKTYEEHLRNVEQYLK